MLHPQPEDNRICWLMGFVRVDERETCYLGLCGGCEAYPSGGPSLPAKEIELTRNAPIRPVPAPFPTATALARHVYALGDAALRSFWSPARDSVPETAVAVLGPAD